MQLARTFLGSDPLGFGRGPLRENPVAPPQPIFKLGEDARLFACTFAAGFLFVSCFLA